MPNPLNLWMNIPVAENSKLSIEPPASRAGDEVVLRALIDCIVIFSACPMDVTPINGPDCTPRPVHYARLPAGWATNVMVGEGRPRGRLKGQPSTLVIDLVSPPLILPPCKASPHPRR